MGRLTNATGVRLGIYRHWKHPNNALFSANYIEDWKFAEYLQLLCNYAFSSEKLSKAFNFLVGDVKVLKEKQVVTIEVSIYNGDTIDNPTSLAHKYVLDTKLVLLERILLESATAYYSQPVKIRFVSLANDNLTASLLVNYIQIKLYQGFSVNEVTFSLRDMLNLNHKLGGYRIDFSGRFTRKQRASFVTFKGGQVPFSTRKVFLDYADGSAVLKYGKCGIKVWLNRPSEITKEKGKLF